MLLGGRGAPWAVPYSWEITHCQGLEGSFRGLSVDEIGDSARVFLWAQAAEKAWEVSASAGCTAALASRKGLKEAPPWGGLNRSGGFSPRRGAVQ